MSASLRMYVGCDGQVDGFLCPNAESVDADEDYGGVAWELPEGWSECRLPSPYEGAPLYTVGGHLCRECTEKARAK